jgi:hypothetical protein
MFEWSWFLIGVGFMDEAGNTVDTDRLKWKTLGQGVSTTVVAAFDPSIAGMFMSPGGVNKADETTRSKWCVPRRLSGRRYARRVDAGPRGTRQALEVE